jgi:hypothetical protein
VRRSPLYEVVGQLGMWGVIINGVQASIIEHHKMREVTWDGRNSMSTLRAYRISHSLGFPQLASCSVTQLVRVSWVLGLQCID